MFALIVAAAVTDGGDPPANPRAVGPRAGVVAVTPLPSPAPALSPQGSAPPSTAARPAESPALALLRTLAVKGRAPRTGYDRDAFGPRWADVDRNGCDTRNDILRRDLVDERFRPGTRGCVVLSGTLAEPYTGRVVTFRKSDPSAVQIDHVVSLSDAWQTGAQQWAPEQRRRFANDPLNLLAVDGRANSAKSDANAASWLPPSRAYRCPMVARQIAVKARYRLWVIPAEQAAMARVLAACPGQRLPTG